MISMFSLAGRSGHDVGVLFAQQAPVSDTVANPLAEQSDSGRRWTAHLRRHVPDVPRRRRRRRPERGSPALNTTGLKQGDGDADLFRTIRQGVSGTQMPPYKGLRDEQVWQLVSYIRSLQNRARVAGGRARRTLPAEGDVAAGEALFFGKAGCASCHEVNARGGVTGPDLSNAGRLSTGCASARRSCRPTNRCRPFPARAAAAEAAAALRR